MLRSLFYLPLISYPFLFLKVAGFLLSLIPVIFSSDSSLFLYVLSRLPPGQANTAPVAVSISWLSSCCQSHRSSVLLLCIASCLSLPSSLPPFPLSLIIPAFQPFHSNKGWAKVLSSILPAKPNYSHFIPFWTSAFFHSACFLLAPVAWFFSNLTYIVPNIISPPTSSFPSVYCLESSLLF